MGKNKLQAELGVSKEKAEELGANAVVGVRFQTSMILSGTAELLVYGTAVKLSKP